MNSGKASRKKPASSDPPGPSECLPATLISSYRILSAGNPPAESRPARGAGYKTGTMTPHITTLVRLILLVGFCHPAEADGDHEAWLSEKRLIIENVRSGKDDESTLEELGRLARQLGRKKNSLGEGEILLYREAVKTLSSNPAYIQHFASRIAKITEDEISKTGSQHSSQRGWYYETLSQLRNPQTVKILGEFVFDERDPWKNENWGDGGRPYANSFHAVEAFHKLGLKKPPVTREYPDVYGDVRTWQLWYEQVRAGTRTFSFEGDDTIYTLAGPVRESREPNSSPASQVALPLPGSLEKPSGWKLTLAAIGAFSTLLALLFAAFRKPAKRHPI